MFLLIIAVLNTRPLRNTNISVPYVLTGLNELMESKGGKKKSSSSSKSFYEAPLGYSIEDIRPNGGITKFKSAAYSNVCVLSFEFHLEQC